MIQNSTANAILYKKPQYIRYLPSKTFFFKIEFLLNIKRSWGLQMTSANKKTKIKTKQQNNNNNKKGFVPYPECVF